MTSAPTASHQHVSGFTVSVPSAWNTVLDPRPGIALLSVDAWRKERFRANHVVTVDALPDKMDLRSWQLAQDHALPRVLLDYLLLDLESVDVNGGDGVRRLASYRSDHGFALTMSQTAMLVGSRGYTLTSTLSTLDVPRLGGMVDDVADSFVVTGGENR